MEIRIPSADGKVNKYNLTPSTQMFPRIYFVNGIKTTGREHARTASLLSLLTERPIWGIYK